MRKFNTTGLCIPSKHYMVDLAERIAQICKLVNEGAYFTINCARQYGKTTILNALANVLSDKYLIISLDFQAFGSASYKNENTFSVAFASCFAEYVQFAEPKLAEHNVALQKLLTIEEREESRFDLRKLFRMLQDFCLSSSKLVVLMIDEVDSAANNQVFLDFLGQLRNYYLDRERRGVITFQSVILAGLYDVKNLKRKIRSEEEHKFNSPWNIAADFDVDMSFSVKDIAGMLEKYEADCQTGMDIAMLAGMLYDYTSGYPFLVSKLCKLMDEQVAGALEFQDKSSAWTGEGFQVAVKMLLNEKNTLFESLTGKLLDYPELNAMLRSLLFTGKSIVYNLYEPSIGIATMFGFIKNHHGTVAIANRIFETWLYNFYLSSAEMQGMDIYKASLLDKNQFLADGHLNMRLILEKFVVHFHDLYGTSGDEFVEEEGRKYFLLYLRPIINGTGNYYIEARTRSLGRTDVVVDYRGEQYVIELKIWRGNEYNTRGEEQLVGYLEDYRIKKGYMLSFNFNNKKQVGVFERIVGEKILVEAVV